MHNKLKIIFYEPSSGFGGSGRALFHLLSCLDRTSYEPIVATVYAGPQFAKIEKLGIPLSRLSSRSVQETQREGYFAVLRDFLCETIPLAIKLISLIKKNKVNLVHVNTNIMTGLPAILAAHFSGIPCVCHIRQTRALINRERKLVKLVDKFILINRGAEMVYSKDIPAEKLEIVYDGLILSSNERVYDTKRIKDEFGLEGSFSVGIIGRLVEGKGQDDFIRAAAQVIKLCPKVKFMIVGNDSSENKQIESGLKRLVNELNLKEYIIFTGWRNDVDEIISALDVVVQASSTFPEGFGLTIVEAMAQAKPVIATNIPGPCEIVVDGVTGLMVPPGNPQALAGAMIKLLENPDLAKKMGEGGRARVEELFDMKKNVKQIEAIYEEILKES